MPDDRAAACHPLNADREGDGHDRGQPLGNGRYGQADPGERRVRCRKAAKRGGQTEHDRRRSDRERYRSPHAVELARQGRLQRVGAFQQRRDPSQLGHGSGGHGDPLA